MKPGLYRKKLIFFTLQMTYEDRPELGSLFFLIYHSAKNGERMETLRASTMFLLMPCDATATEPRTGSDEFT